MCPVGINNKQSHAAANPKNKYNCCPELAPQRTTIVFFPLFLHPDCAVTVIIHHQQGIYNQSAS